MSNSYATVPAIIPGDLQVQGNLTVSGQRFTFGRLQRKYRIQEMGNGWFNESDNIDCIAVQQDDPSYPSLIRTLEPQTNPFSIRTDPAGAPATQTVLLSLQPSEFAVVVPSLRVGATTPYVRLISVPPNAGTLTYNLQGDGITRDDVTKTGQSFTYNTVNRQFGGATVDTLGNIISSDSPRVFWLDHTPHHITGVSGQQTVASKTVYGNQLTANGTIYLRFRGGLSTTAVGPTNIGCQWAGNNINVVTVPASTSANYWCEFWLINTNSTGAQIVAARGGFGTTFGTLGAFTYSVDSTQNWPLAIIVTPADTGTTIDLQGIEAEFLTRGIGL